MNLPQRSLVPAALALACALPAPAALFVNLDLGPLGPLGPGTTNLTGDTAGGVNNADTYVPLADSGANWGAELVYEFTVTETVRLSLQGNSFTGDPDFFLLGGLGTASSPGGKVVATDTLAYSFLDLALPQTAILGVLGAGTYFLSAETFVGFDGAVVPGSALFDIDLIFEAFTLPTSTYLGVLAAANEAFTVDTFGSSFDTELGLWDNLGNLILTNDDAGGPQSLLDLSAGLAEGTYYLGLGSFNTEFGANSFGVTPGTDFGSFDLNIPGGVAEGSLSRGEVAYFTFDIVPEPGTTVLAALGLAGLLSRRLRT